MRSRRARRGLGRLAAGRDDLDHADAGDAGLDAAPSAWLAEPDDDWSNSAHGGATPRRHRADDADEEHYPDTYDASHQDGYGAAEPHGYDVAEADLHGVAGFDGYPTEHDAYVAAHEGYASYAPGHDGYAEGHPPDQAAGYAPGHDGYAPDHDGYASGQAGYAAGHDDYALSSDGLQPGYDGAVHAYPTAEPYVSDPAYGVEPSHAAAPGYAQEGFYDHDASGHRQEAPAPRRGRRAAVEEPTNPAADEYGRW